MAFVFIDKPLSKLINDYQFAIKTLKKHDRLETAQEYEDRLRVVLAYQQRVKNESRFKSIQPLKIKNPSLYVKKCKALCEKISGVHFCKRSHMFVVRCSFDGKRTYVGSMESFDDAVDILQSYIKAKLK